MNTKTRHIAGAGLGLLTILGNADAEIVGYEKYIHDAAGNLVEKQIDDQITRFDYEGNILKADSTGSAYRHDSAGRLVAASGARGVERELTYQFGDKITRVEKGGTATELLYNAEGQLVGRNSSGQTEVFAWDGLGLVMRGQESYANEIGIAGERPVLSNEDVVVSDYLGTTLNISGESFFGTAFGEGLRNAFFTGKPYVDSLEGYVFKWRNYMSDLGRWTTLDPLGYPDGAGPFSYTNGDPVNSFDELGLFGSYFIDPANNNMDPDQGWSMYNTFHTANNDNPLIGFHTPGNGHFQDSAGDIWEVRIKYEYVRKPNGTNLTIPANTELEVKTSYNQQSQWSGGVNIVDLLNIGTTFTSGWQQGVTRKYAAYRMGKPDAFDYHSKALLRKEQVMIHCQRRPFDGNNGWGAWFTYTGSPHGNSGPGQYTTGHVGFTKDILGLLQQKEN